MAGTKPVQTFKDESIDLEKRIISAISSVGPRNVAEISRVTGAHQETIRYKMKRQFIEQGFRFQADIDYRKLGLTLYWGRFVISPGLYESPIDLFRLLNDVAYLVYFSKILPQGHFVTIFSLPEGTIGEFTGFLESLRQRKVFSEFSLDRVLAQRHKSMDPQFFDFRRDRWEVDWDRVRRLRASPLGIERGRPEIQADYMDMLIIKELQKDARQHVTEIASKLRVLPKTLEYHYRTHVMKGLIPGFRVRWMKDTDEPLSHSAISARLTFEGLEGGRYKAVQSAMNRLPYLWVEDLVEPSTYIATLAIPLADFGPTMRYVNKELQFLGKGFEMGYLSVEESKIYTIPYHMFSKGRWRFDPKRAESAVLKELEVSLEK